jgi:hypothetical protein
MSQHLGAQHLPQQQQQQQQQLTQHGTATPVAAVKLKDVLPLSEVGPSRVPDVPNAGPDSHG